MRAAWWLRKFTFPSNVDGWLTPNEGATLAILARGKTVLEIGSFHGRSTICMAQTATKVHAVDWCKGDDGQGWSLPFLADNLRRYAVEDKVVLHVGRFTDVAPLMAPATFDLAFVDGAHDYESVVADLREVKRLVRPGGVVALHDFDRSGVQQAALDELGWSDRQGVLVDLLFTARL